jgi:uncharacterized protein (TIGR02598 family)
MKIHPYRHLAFSLVEVVLALGIASISMVSILGLLPVGLNSSRSSTAQTGAMNLITAIAADIRATSSTASVSPRYSISTGNTASQTFYFDEQDNITTGLQTSSRYKAAVQAVWQPSTNETLHRVTVSWPAQAPASAPGSSVDVMVSLARN